MRISRTHIFPALHSILLGWYHRSRRDFPWRSTRDPYAILVAEVMLQQTQTERVRDTYLAFLDSFPTFSALASASRADVLRSWKGLGYNNRAVRLHACARQVLDTYGGILPVSPKDLQTLPGLGTYTAHAVACFAFGMHVPVVDVNIRRVLTRIFWRTRHQATLADHRTAWSLAKIALPSSNASAWHQALMDLGAVICTKRLPLCASCPVGAQCLSRSALHRSSLTPVQKRREPSYRGTPRRLWRGRVVNSLRSLPGGSTLSIRRLARQLGAPDRPVALAWLRKLIRNLERDGILEAGGSPSNLRLRLSRQ